MLLNAEHSPGVKMGGSVSHLLTELHVVCLPRHLPEQIEVDLSEVELDGMLHISDLTLSGEIDINERVHGTADHPVVSIHLRRIAQVDEGRRRRRAGRRACGGRGRRRDTFR